MRKIETPPVDKNVTKLKPEDKNSEEITFFFLNEKYKELKSLKIIPLHESLSAEFLGYRILSDAEKIQLSDLSLTIPFPQIKPKKQKGN